MNVFFLNILTVSSFYELECVFLGILRLKKYCTILQDLTQNFPKDFNNYKSDFHIALKGLRKMYGLCEKRAGIWTEII